MSLYVIDESKRCLKCKVPLCSKRGCPVHTPIPQVMTLFQEGQLMEAGQILFANNPMSVVCAHVCNHGEQCEGSCVCGRKGTPIHFSEVEKFVSEAYLARADFQRPEPNGHRAAVIGAGPAGLTAAIRLAQAGCEVTLFEQKNHVGGVLRYGIPDFRLSKHYLDEYRQLLTRLGVKVRPNTTIGGALHIDDLLADGYETVFVGTGAMRAKTLGIHGQARGNVLFGIDYLMGPQSFEVGRSVVVIGVGNVAMDAARTALRQGARKVTLVSNWGGTSANSDEVELALLDGATIEYGLSVQRIDEEGPVFLRSQLDADGQVVGLADEEVTLPCDTVIFCVSQVPKDKLKLTTQGLETTPAGTLVVDENFRTTVPHVYAAGDVVSGPKTVVHAVADTKLAVDAMLAEVGVGAR